MSRGAGVRWTPLNTVGMQKHRPSRQARPSPSAPAKEKSLDFVDVSTISGFFLFEIFVASVLKNDIKYHRKAQKYKSTCKSKIRKSKTVFERIKS